MQMKPSPAIWNKVAAQLGSDTATLKAVFEVEAAGKFFNSDGSIPRRFEPHHFPKRFWGTLGFNPGNRAAWRASLALKTSVRRAMFDRAENMDTEATFDAASWGAPQIMGFNAELAGHDSAVEMVDAMQQGADQQVIAFFNFVENAGLSTHLRSHNWLAFAAGYNGSGQAPVYAAKIESAYRRQSGGKASAALLRVGSKGKAVEDLQEYLAQLGYDIVVDGHYGIGTQRTVRSFQTEQGLTVDGIAGAATQRALRMAASELLDEDEEVLPEIGNRTEKQTPIGKLQANEVIKSGTAILGGGGFATLMGALNENAQTILIGGAVVGAIIIGTLYFWKRLN